MIDSEIFHILPVNDIDHHHESISCPCNPQVDNEYENIIIHNAFDGREFKEQMEMQ